MFEATEILIKLFNLSRIVLQALILDILGLQLHIPLEHMDQENDKQTGDHKEYDKQERIYIHQLLWEVLSFFIGIIIDKDHGT